MNKKLTTLGCLLVLGVLAAPVTMAHIVGGANNGIPEAATGVDVWGAAPGPTGPYSDGPTSVAARPEPGPYTGVVPAGWYYGSVSAYLADDTGVLLAGAFALCDMEVLSDGNSGSPEDNILDEGDVEGTGAGGSLPDGMFDDGGVGGACHTHEDLSSDNTYGYYENDDYNTGGCPSGQDAYGWDFAFGGDVWISTACDFAHVNNGTGALSVFTGCASDAVLTQEPADLVDCTAALVACVTGVACATTGGTVECGQDGTADNGNFGRGGAGVPFGSAIINAGTATEADCDMYSSSVVFVWNEVTVPNSELPPATATAATWGWVSGQAP